MSTKTRHYEIQIRVNNEWKHYASHPTLAQARNHRAALNETPGLRYQTYRVVAVERRVIWMETEWDTIPAVKEYVDE